MSSWPVIDRSTKMRCHSSSQSSAQSLYEAALLAHGWVRRMPVDERTWQRLGVYDKNQKTVTVTVEKADFSGKVPGGDQVSLAMNDLPAP